VLRRTVIGVLAACAVVGFGLLALSVVPNGVLLGRLFGAAGEARAGANAQELATFLDVRLRLAAALLLALSAGLYVMRGTVSELVAATPGAIAWPALNWWTLGTVGGLTLVGAALRIVFLSQPMRYDEALTFNEFASRPLYYGLSFYPDPNNHLLNTLLMHVGYTLLGNQPWVLRLPAFLAGVVLVPATYWLGRLMYGTGAGVLACALVAVGSYLVEYSTNARGYTLQALCFVVFFALAVLAVRERRRGALLLAAIVAALGAYTLPTMLYGVVIVAVWALSLRRDQPKDLVASGLVLGLATTLLYLPVLVISGADKLVGNRFVVPLTWHELWPELGRSLARTWGFWNRDVPWLLAAALVVGFGITLVFELRARRLPVGLLAPLVCLMLVVLQRVAPFERVWLFMLPLYFAVAGAGLARFVDGRILALIFGIAIGYFTLTSGSILASDETGAFPDAEAVTRTLAPRLAPDDAVLTQLPASLPELQYYFPRSGLPTSVLVRPPQDGQNLWVITAPDAAAPQVQGFAGATEVQRLSGAALWELRR
jgi:dolichyl-phosphate-mannose-protein mannosyltransferase